MTAAGEKIWYRTESGTLGSGEVLQVVEGGDLEIQRHLHDRRSASQLVGVIVISARQLVPADEIPPSVIQSTPAMREAL